MANTNTKIEWTDATWSPVTGCTKVSPGCLHCYAEAITRRFAPHGWFVPWTVAAQHRAELPGGITAYSPIQLHAERLEDPLRWRTPRRVFVNSMSDLFHEAVPDDFVRHVWLTMALAQQHSFQVLTKRPERMRDVLTRMQDLPGGHHLFGSDLWPLPNVWLGASVENQRYAGERIPLLAQTPATVRFLSCEPLLGPLDLRHWLYPSSTSLSWVILGGESGPKARPMDLAWARDIVRQCRQAGVPVFVKQLGTHPTESGTRYPLRDLKGGNPQEWPEDLRVREFPENVHAPEEGVVS